jgi:hypothetical protein
MLVTPGAVESGGRIQIDHAALMFGVATETSDFVVASQEFQSAAGDQSGIVGNVVAAMRIHVCDIAVAGDAAVAHGTMPGLMARGALTAQVIVRRHQFTGLVTFAAREREGDEHNRHASRYEERSPHQMPAK